MEDWVLPCKCSAWCENGKKSQPLEYEIICLQMIQEFIPPPIENVEFAYSFQRFLPFLPYSEVNLTESYPNIKVHGNTPHETSRHCNITSTPRVMEYCWNNNHNFVYDHCNDAYFKKLLNSDTVPPLIKKFLQKYRLDIYGNVISQTSSKNSLVGLAYSN